MQGQRCKGFVIGCDPGPQNSTVWKVRVKDVSSPYNEHKLTVASMHDGIALAQGLNVNFIIGTVDGKDEFKINKAVDVQLDLPSSR